MNNEIPGLEVDSEKMLSREMRQHLESVRDYLMYNLDILTPSELNTLAAIKEKLSR